ncbi:putative HVA22-like protein g isoform X2 [Eutrema salsugineum]|uniref:putative HVA22-like protein g isoform X2 n=1 Tax=Eutrema salsugineum TaxID=72664 RepID=UPI000CECE9B3|nr:putative HVA22-like protein g isoform X2 [Eutrema salsugineum]
MLGDLITRILILLVGYAYPAYGCYKSVEKKKPEIQELRYWCKYWILLGLLTVFERIGDIVVSWLPLYAEIKIAIFIYLWYPKSQGISYVYEKLLCPYISRHESDIDQGISVLKIRGRSVIVQLVKCGYHWTLQIFRHVQQHFAIYKKNDRSKSKERQQTATSFMFLR